MTCSLGLFHRTRLYTSVLVETRKKLRGKFLSFSDPATSCRRSDKRGLPGRKRVIIRWSARLGATDCSWARLIGLLDLVIKPAVRLYSHLDRLNRGPFGHLRQKLSRQFWKQAASKDVVHVAGAAFHFLTPLGHAID